MNGERALHPLNITTPPPASLPAGLAFNSAAGTAGREWTDEERKRTYEARGSVYEKFFYDRSPIVGLAGPAGTGKSRCALEKVHMILEGVPGARAFVARKTRESMTESALYTYEEHVLPPGHPCLGGARRVNRSQYLYPNGSLLVVVGLDKPQRIMSTEFDIGYVQELVECDAEDVDMLMTRLRAGTVPYQQLLFDVNPDSPQHWIYQWWLKQNLVMYDTHHEDNPRLWQDDPNGPDYAYDGRRGYWTRGGLEYIAKLDALTGPRKDRLRFGKWVTAEGCVYADSWDPRINLCNWFEPPRSWRRFWSVDFGYTHPFVLQMWAVDEDGRMWMYREIYRTNTLVSENARRALEIAGWSWDPERGHQPTRENPDPLPEYVVMDWDAEGRATFEDSTGLRGEPAYKSILDGINAVSERLTVAGDGLPRMFLMRDALDEEDEDLKDKMQPLCTSQEFTAYVWDMKQGRKQKEMPIDKYNHGMDAARYAVAREDNLRDDFKAKDVPVIAHVPEGTQVEQIARMFVAAIGAAGRGSHNDGDRRRDRGPRRNKRRPRQ